MMNHDEASEFGVLLVGKLTVCEVENHRCS